MIVMGDRDKSKLRLALAIISGRYTHAELVASWAMWELMGYDPYKFSTFGVPDMDEVRRWAEKYVAERIIE